MTHLPFMPQLLINSQWYEEDKRQSGENERAPLGEEISKTIELASRTFNVSSTGSSS
jgi:hypothetical protein